jgi:hypothetical protein
MTERIALFSFLSRADATPLNQRSRANGFVLGQNGNPVDDPITAAALGFEPDPNVNFEHWGDYWRKVHGVRFVHPENDTDQQTLKKLLRYDQIHRFAPGPSSETPLPYLPPVDADGELFDTIIGHVAPYRRPAWDGVAYLQFANLDDLKAVLGSERVLRKIAPEDRAMFRDLAPILAKQHVIKSGSGNDAITLVKSHRRGDGLDRAAFQSNWKRAAGRIFRSSESARMMQSYVQLLNIGPEVPGLPFYHAATAAIDGVTLMTFGSVRDVETFLQSADYAALLAAEAEIAASRTDYWTGVTCAIVDRSGAQAELMS